MTKFAYSVINKQIELKAAEHIENINHLKKQLEDKDDTIKVVDLKIEVSFRFIRAVYLGVCTLVTIPHCVCYGSTRY